MTWSLGLFSAVSFVLCVLYGLAVPETLHMAQFLEITLSGFRWLSPGSFVLGRPAVSLIRGVRTGGTALWRGNFRCAATDISPAVAG